MRYKTAIKIFLKAVISLTFIYFVFGKLHLENFVNEFKNVKGWYFFAAALLYVSTQLISTRRWSYFVKTKKKYKELFELYMIGTFFNLFLPGTIGGDAVKAYYLYKGTQKKGDSLVSVFMERYMGLCGLMVIATAGFIWGFNYVRDTFVIKLFGIMLAGFASASIIVVYFPYEMFYEKLKGVRISIGNYLRDKRVVTATFLLSVTVQAIGICVVYLLGLSLEMETDFKVYVIFIPIISVISMIPVSFSGVGVREYSFLYLYGMVGVPKEKSVTLAILWFAVMILTGIIGMFYYLKKRG